MDTYVLGLALSPPCTAQRGQRTEEMTFETVHAALRSAGVERTALDHVTLATSDEMDGRSISSMLMAMPGGAYLKDELRVTDSGLTGLVMGALRVASGRFHLGVVVSWSHTSQIDVDALTGMRAEPFALRPIGLNSVIADGLFAGAVRQRFGFDDAGVDARIAARRRQAACNPRALQGNAAEAGGATGDDLLAWPLRRRHRAAASDGCVAFVLASAQWLAAHPGHRPLARIAAVASAIDSYRLDGERLGGMAMFDQALAEVLQRSGRAPDAAIDVAEIEAPTAWHDLAIERHLADRRVGALSPSGGVWAQNPLFCAGLVNAAEAALQVAGRAGDVQVPGARFAVAHGSHGYAQQGQTFVAFEGVAA